VIAVSLVHYIEHTCVNLCGFTVFTVKTCSSLGARAGAGAGGKKGETAERRRV